MMAKNEFHSKILNCSKEKKRNLFKKKKVKNKGNLRRAVKRDRQCMCCRSRENLSAHHIIFKSLSGDDSLDNLITLCFECHRKAHDGFYIDKNFCSGDKFVIDILERLDYGLYKEKLEELRKSNGI